MAEDQRTGRDKAEHVFASAALAAAGNEYGQRQPLSGRQNQTIGILFSLSIGAEKSDMTAARMAAAGAGKRSCGMPRMQPAALPCEI